MYCPVDGMEWREGITRCPEHDVDLVDEPPEVDEEPALLERLHLEGLAGIAVVVVAAAALLHGLTGVVLAGWFALSGPQLADNVFVDVLLFADEAVFSVGVGTLGCLVAGVLGRTWTRLGSLQETPRVPPSRAEGEDDLEDALGGPAAWIVTLLSSLVVVFALLWAATGVAISWEGTEFRYAITPFAGEAAGPSETFLKLSALHNAAYTCGLAALASMGALLLARVYDRMAGVR